jgi:iron complex outermembrane recepter protein
MNTDQSRAVRSWLLAALLAVPLAAAVAQEADPDADTGEAVSEEKRMEEVVVTARRRDENLSRVPIAVTAISGEALLERSIRTDSDLQLSAPGLTIRQTQGNNSLTYSIRGQTADTFSGSPSAVVTYLNDVPLTISGASTFFDPQSVQVLKGPQGTLFGRNATGGAVLFTTAKPTTETEALIRSRVGNLELREIDGAFNAIKREGYIRNLFDGSNLGETDRQSGRLSMTVTPGAGIENTTVFQFSETDGTNTGASYTYSVYLDRCKSPENPGGLTCAAGFLFGPTLDLVFGDGSWDSYLAEHPNAYAPGLVAYVDEQRRLGPYVTNHPGGARHQGRDWLLSNTTTFELTGDLQLKNIFGASHADTDSEQPQLGAPFITILTANLATGRSGNELEVDSFSDELQLHGAALGGRLSYIAGFYVQRQRSDTLWPQTYFELHPVLEPATATNNFRIENETDAVYTQGTYDLGALIDGLRVTAGLRYTWERVSIEQLREADAFGAASQSETFHDPSWELGLEYDATESLFTYLKTRGSFRSGGFNGSAPPVTATATEGGNLFESEHVKDVEAGLKYRGELLGRPASLNLAVYQQWITDVQRVEFPDPDGDGPIQSIAVTANVPEAEVRGIEAEATLMPLDWLQIGALGAYTDAEFSDGDINLFGTPYRYGPFGDTPELSGVFYTQVDMPAPGAAGALSLRAEVYGQTEQYFSNAADTIAPGTRLPGYALVNARLALSEIRGSGFSAALFSRNLLDKAYFAGGMTLAAALGHNAAAVGEPRTYGLEVSYRF